MASLDDFNAKQLKELVTCGLCLDNYNDPRLLPCSHTFCMKCIEQLVKENLFECPLRDETKLNGDQISKLPVNRAVKDMVDFVASINLSTNKNGNCLCDNCNQNSAVNWCDQCGTNLCESCTSSIHSIKIFKSHTVVPAMEKSQSFCLDHSDEKFKYWCRQCELLVCRDCLLFKHKDHLFSPLKDAAAEAQTQFLQLVQQINEVKENLSQFSNTTKSVLNEQRRNVAREKQNIEQTFTALQKMLDERKQILIKTLNEHESQMIKVVDQQQNIIDQHLNLTLVQELCIKKMQNSNDPMQVLKLKSAISQNYGDFVKQYKKIDEGFTFNTHSFKRDEKELKQIEEQIAKLGRIVNEPEIVKRDGIEMKILTLNISKLDGQTRLTPTKANYARGYQFSLKRPFRLESIRIQSDHVGLHFALAITDADVVIQNGNVISHNSTIKWLTIPLKCEMKNNYTILVWSPSGHGSYSYKNGDHQCRRVNENCAVKSRYAESPPLTSTGSIIAVARHAYSIDMILNPED